MLTAEHREAGGVLLLVILVAVIVTLAITVTFAVTANNTHSAKQFQGEVTDRVVAEAGIEAVRASISADPSIGDPASVDLPTLSQAVLAHAASTGSDVLGTQDAAYDAAQAGMPPAIGGAADEDGNTPVWQVIDVDAPDPANGNGELSIIVRGWIQSSATTASDSILLQARMRTGTYADFQLLSDGPIRLEPGASITGLVHSNGNVSEVDAIPATPGMRIWAEGGSATCSGSFASVTTTLGTIDPSISGCEAREGTRVTHAVAAGIKSFEMIDDSCGSVRATARVACFDANGAYTINLNGYSASVSGPSSGTVAWSDTQSATIRVRGAATVTGQSRGRLTIAADPGETVGTSGSISIGGGNVGAQPSGWSSLGLLARDDIKLGDAGCASQVHAAALAVSGSFGIDEALRSEIQSGSGSVSCGDVSVVGSVVSHSTPILHWSWGGAAIGFAGRSFTYDDRLRSIPPPFMPLLDRWKVMNVTLANADCIGAATC